VTRWSSAAAPMLHSSAARPGSVQRTDQELRRKLAGMIRLADHLHLPASDRGDPQRYKEWQHFCVSNDQVSLVVNLSLAGVERARAMEPEETAQPTVLDPRVTVLLHSREGGWEGAIEAIPARDFAHRTGQMEFALGSNRLEFRGGVYHLTLALQDQPIAARLALRPLSMPLLLTKLPVSSGDIHWFVLPRLEASGELSVGRRLYRFTAAPAYHDHNWGRWGWGDDFAWQWGYALHPGEPAWSLVFDRITDRRRLWAPETTLVVWRGQRLVKAFRADQVRSTPVGHQPRAPIAKFPPIMRLLCPEWTSEVPRMFRIEAEARGDRLTVELDCRHFAQIVVPNERDLGVTAINEVEVASRLEGRLRGEPIAVEGAGLFEFHG
jgi:hypothetical protein